MNAISDLKQEIQSLEQHKQKILTMISTTESHISNTQSQIKAITESIATLQSNLTKLRKDFRSQVSRVFNV
jgi:predicted  nucleic acid-binding Zn-ribbon protein